ncbi:MAG: hypothetical protein PHY47_00365 [Lachnospiraceae bacterium]|nr:hypothetical protein [Lachnospiraceae bacterium]
MKDNIFKLYSESKSLYLIEFAMGSALFKLLPFDKGRIAERICKSFPALTAKIEEDIWDECIIESSFPSNLEDMNAGIIATIVRVILRLSTPSSIEDMQKDLDRERLKLKDVRDQMVIKICEAFPSYTPEDVIVMDWTTLIERLSQAEKILGIEFNITTGEDSAKKAQDQALATSGVATRKGSDGSQYIDFAKENAALRE